MATSMTTRCSVFDRIVCAVDGSLSSLEAVRQARILLSGLGRIELVGVFEPPAVGYSPFAVPLQIAGARSDCERNLVAAKELCPEVPAQFLDGPAERRLLDRLVETNASLVAVGAKGRNRAVGFVRGSLTTAVLHRTAASVLVARAKVLDDFPLSVVVGYDGSAGADAALVAGLDVAARFDSDLRVVAAGDAAAIESDAIADLRVERDEGDAVRALLRASEEADLLVVGSRGMRGVRAVGSVSERLGHQASCSVLVVKRPDLHHRREEVRW
jgi:nucleotide-binding universal stress UspA family protein